MPGADGAHAGPRFAGCLVNGCKALEIPVDLGELLSATELSGGSYEGSVVCAFAVRSPVLRGRSPLPGSTFEDCLHRSCIRGR